MLLDLYQVVWASQDGAAGSGSTDTFTIKPSESTVGMICAASVSTVDLAALASPTVLTASGSDGSALGGISFVTVGPTGVSTVFVSAWQSAAQAFTAAESSPTVGGPSSNPEVC